MGHAVDSEVSMRTISGAQLIIDGYTSRASSLDPGSLFDFMDKTVEALGMEYLQKPLAARVPVNPAKLDGDEDEGGWSVVAQITTSHLSIHCWPLRGAFMLDIFSCKPFDFDEALEIAKTWLHIARATIWKIKRVDPQDFSTEDIMAGGLCAVETIRWDDGFD